MNNMEFKQTNKDWRKHLFHEHPHKKTRRTIFHNLDRRKNFTRKIFVFHSTTERRKRQSRKNAARTFDRLGVRRCRAWRLFESFDFGRWRFFRWTRSLNKETIFIEQKDELISWRSILIAQLWFVSENVNHTRQELYVSFECQFSNSPRTLIQISVAFPL